MTQIYLHAPERYKKLVDYPGELSDTIEYDGEMWRRDGEHRTGTVGSGFPMQEAKPGRTLPRYVPA